ncbi:MAG TPA: aminoglycoside phosphotransferase family protein [Acidimicrobiales bacterium]
MPGRGVPVDEAVRRVAATLGAPVRLVSAPVVHHERCVLEVELPDGPTAFAKADLDIHRSDREARVLEAAGRAGVPVPTVLARSAGPPAILVLSDVGGRWLAPTDPAPAWAATGGALRALHRVTVPGLPMFGGGDDWGGGLMAVLDRWGPAARDGGVDAASVGRVRRAIERDGGRSPGPAPPPVTLHGDCAPIHVRTAHRGGGDWRVLGLLDLGDTCRGDALWDLTVLTLRSPERLPDVLAGYGADHALRNRARRQVPAYRALRLVAEAGWLVEHGFDPARAAADAHSAVAGLDQA